MAFYQQIIHGIHIPAAVRIAQQAIDISGSVCTQHDPFAEQIVNTVDGAVQVDIAEVFRDIFRLCGGTSADKYLGAENEIEALSIFEFKLYIPCAPPYAACPTNAPFLGSESVPTRLKSVPLSEE